MFVCVCFCVLKKSRKIEMKSDDDTRTKMQSAENPSLDFLIVLPCCLSSSVLHAMDDDDPEKNQSNKIIKL